MISPLAFIYVSEGIYDPGLCVMWEGGPVVNSLAGMSGGS